METTYLQRRLIPSLATMLLNDGGASMFRIGSRTGAGEADGAGLMASGGLLEVEPLSCATSAKSTNISTRRTTLQVLFMPISGLRRSVWNVLGAERSLQVNHITPAGRVKCQGPFIHMQKKAAVQNSILSHRDA